MSKFNTEDSGSKTINLAGGEAFLMDSKMELVSILLTSFVQDKFYKTESKELSRVKELVNIVDKSFAAKAALFARNKYGMRTISHVVAGEIAASARSLEWTKRFFDKIVRRPDDMGEIIAYYRSKYGKRLTNPMRKGFASALSRFDEYRLAKYRGDKKTFSLVDIVNLVHPKETPAIKKLMTGKLESPETWEVELTRAGQTGGSKEQAWKKLVLEGKIGYFALLRNLRNIMEDAPEAVPAACALLEDREAIKTSLVLPFRYLTALEQIQGLSNARAVVQSIGKALEMSLDNVPVFQGRTLVALDCSGSMQGKPINIGSIFASVLYKKNNADIILFSDQSTPFSLNPSMDVLSMSQMIRSQAVMGGTNFHSIFDTREKYDRIIILSDMQGWMGRETPVSDFNVYKKETGCSPFIYSFDLQGYGSLQFPQPQVFCLAGWSDKVFDTMKVLEEDKNALIHEIERIEL